MCAWCVCVHGVCVSVCVRVSVFVCVYTCACAFCVCVGCQHVCVFTLACVRAGAIVRACLRVCMHACVCACVYVCVWSQLWKPSITYFCRPAQNPHLNLHSRVIALGVCLSSLHNCKYL